MEPTVFSTLVEHKGQLFQVLSAGNELIDPDQLPKHTTIHSYAAALTLCGDSYASTPVIDITLPFFYDETLKDLSPVLLDDGQGRGIEIDRDRWLSHLQKGTALKSRYVKPMIRWEDAFVKIKIPVISNTFKCLNKLHNHSYDANDIIQIIEKDPIAIGQVKRMSNLVMKTQSRAINKLGSDTIEHAVKQVLGPERTRRFLLFHSMQRCLLLNYISEEEVDIRTERAFLLAQETEKIARARGIKDVNALYLAALLSDFAYLALSEVLHAKFRYFMRVINLNPAYPQSLLYRQLTAVSDTAITRAFLSAWGIEEAIIREIEHQYGDDSLISQAKAALVCNGTAYTYGERRSSF